MTVLAYCAQYPTEVDALISISGATHATAQAIAFRALQREIVRSDPEWRKGAYEPGHGPRTGLRLARKLGTITYRGAQEFDTRFGRQRVGEGGAVRGRDATEIRGRVLSRAPVPAFLGDLRRELLSHALAGDG